MSGRKVDRTQAESLSAADAREGRPAPRGADAVVDHEDLVLDFNQLDRLFALDGTGEALHSLIELTREGFPEQLRDLCAAARAEDAGGVQSAAHTMRGSMSVFGDLSVCRLFESVEARARERQMPTVEELAFIGGQADELLRLLIAHAAEVSSDADFVRSEPSGLAGTIPEPTATGGRAGERGDVGDLSMAQVFAQSPLGSVVTDPGGVLRAVNPAFAKLLGRSVADLTGRHLRDITDPPDLAASMAALVRLREGLVDTVQVDKRYVHADGTRIWCRTAASRLVDQAGRLVGFVAQFEDVTRRREAERRLSISETVFRRSFVASPIAKAMVNSDGSVALANPAMLTLIQVSSAEALTLPVLLRGAPKQVTSDVLELFSTDKGSLSFEFSRPVPNSPPRTLRTVVSAVEALTGGTQLIVQMLDVSEQARELAAAIEQATCDPLTGLSNRKHFETALARALAGHRPQHQRVALFVLDLDRFKQVNDGLGHGAGDEVLVEVARRIRGVCRHADTVARVGGDEFWVVATNLDDEIEAMTLATAMLRALAVPFKLTGGTSLHVKSSLGFALASDDAVDGPELMRKADAALYRAKELRSGWAAFNNLEDEPRIDRLYLGGDLREAVEAHALHVDYQPLFDRHRRVVGFEALARWRHPDRGLISPEVFIPLAEQLHLIGDLTRSVLQQAAQQCATWKNNGWDVYVAVNLAAGLLYEDGTPNMIIDELTSAGLAPDRLTLEVTEGAIADGTNPLVAVALKTLRDLGIRLSIDDFGTGYSSLAYLKSLPVHELKIDRSFITFVENDPRDLAIVTTLTQLARTLGLEVVAEGVESDRAAELLLSVGCDVLQGFGLDRPMTAAHASTRLAEQPLQGAGEPGRDPTDPTDLIASAARMRVLTVDDDPMIRQLLRSMLTAAGHEVLDAATGEQALHHAPWQRADLIVLDHFLGQGINGIDTAAALRNAGYDGPIILFSAALPEALAARRFPVDIWPVAKQDHTTLLQLINGYAATVRTRQQPRADTRPHR